MRGKLSLLLILTALLAMLAPASVMAQTDDEPVVVRAVLFYSPTCPHCHLVIQEVLIPMSEQYGDKLQVLGVDTSQPSGGQLYQLAIERFDIPDARRGVPTLIIGDTVLVGSREIPDQFPGLVEEYLAAEGMDWPDMPEFVQAIEALAQAQPTEEVQPTDEVQATEDVQPTEETSPAEDTQEAVAQATAALLPTATSTPAAVAEQAVIAISKNDPLPAEESVLPSPDPVGIGLAAILLIFMITTLVFVVWRLMIGPPQLFPLNRNVVVRISGWAIPMVSLLGFGVALYLAYVEVNQVEAVCGPIGQCNIVQSSEYAQLLGVPIAVWGVLSYTSIIVLWAVQRYAQSTLGNLSLLGLAVLSVWATLFSIYLTLLEIFVIHAVCAWCMSSAIISTVLMLLVIVPLTPVYAKIEASATA